MKYTFRRIYFLFHFIKSKKEGGPRTLSDQSSKQCEAFFDIAIGFENFVSNMPIKILPTKVKSKAIAEVQFYFRDGAVRVRALSSHQCGPGSIPRLGVIKWVEFVGSLLCIERFSPGSCTPVSPRHKNRHLT